MPIRGNFDSPLDSALLENAAEQWHGVGMRPDHMNLALIDLFKSGFDETEQNLSIDYDLPMQDAPCDRNSQTHKLVFRIAPQDRAGRNQILHHSRKLADLGVQLLLKRLA
jgi:hypothetical protein